MHGANCFGRCAGLGIQLRALTDIMQAKFRMAALGRQVSRTPRTGCLVEQTPRLMMARAVYFNTIWVFWTVV